jgi:hypothetical protein
MTTQFKGLLIAHGFNIQVTKAKSKAETELEIRKLLRIETVESQEESKGEEAKVPETAAQDVELIFKELSEEEESVIVQFAIVRFKDYTESVRYFHKNKDLKLLSPPQIAALLQPPGNQKQSDG